MGRPTTLRPFICDGSPYDCHVFIVGFNPATDSNTDFWTFWDNERGFDKRAWYENYLRDRKNRPLKPGKTRRNAVSNTRRVMNWIEEEAQSVRFLETNIYSSATEEARDLSISNRTTKAFDYLMSELTPVLILAHGDDAIGHLRSSVDSSKLRALSHFSRKWSEAGARELGRDIAIEIGNG